MKSRVKNFIKSAIIKSGAFLWKTLKVVFSFIVKILKKFFIIIWKIIKVFYRCLRYIFFFVFPFLEIISPNVKIKKQKVVTNLSDEYSLEQVNLDKLEKHYNETFDVKNSLESKAQNSIFSLTIVISLVFSILGLKKDVLEELPCNIQSVVITLSVIMLAYFMLGGFLNLYLIIGKNSMRFLTWQDECFKWENLNDKKEYLCECIELNIKTNQIRHNVITCAYKCIIDGLVILMIIFALIIV